MPDLVILLDVDLETSARRLARPLDKLENRGDEYRSRLRSGYRDEATRQPERIVTIDATAGVEDVAAAIRLAVTTRFPELA
jgi:dTMP kinase